MSSNPVNTHSVGSTETTGGTEGLSNAIHQGAAQPSPHPSPAPQHPDPEQGRKAVEDYINSGQSDIG